MLRIISINIGSTILNSMSYETKIRMAIKTNENEIKRIQRKLKSQIDQKQNNSVVKFKIKRNYGIQNKQHV